jgi:hypothetical protein
MGALRPLAEGAGRTHVVVLAVETVDAHGLDRDFAVADIAGEVVGSHEKMKRD